VNLKFLPVFFDTAPDLFPDPSGRMHAAEHQILCPFHSDTAPSCRVNLQTGLWRCFGCKKSGQAADFMSLYLGINIHAAAAKVDLLLREAGPVAQVAPVRARSRVHRHAVTRLTGWLLACAEQYHDKPEVAKLVEARDLFGLTAFFKAHAPPHLVDPVPRLRGATFDELGSPRWWQAMQDTVQAVVTRAPISQAIIDYYREALDADHALLLMGRRGWTKATLRQFQIGWDSALERYTIPVFVDKVCVNIRKYQPGAPANKMISYGEHYGAPRFYPYDVMKGAPFVIWLEGEPDTILGHQYALPAVTVTGGAGTVPADARSFLKGKEVVLCFDCDEAGTTGTTRVSQMVRSYVKSVRAVRLPMERRGADFSDFMLTPGRTIDEFWSLVNTTETL
jgi:hypothetical protein